MSLSRIVVPPIAMAGVQRGHTSGQRVDGAHRVAYPLCSTIALGGYRW